MRCRLFQYSIDPVKHAVVALHGPLLCCTTQESREQYELKALLLQMVLNYEEFVSDVDQYFRTQQ